MPGSSSRTPKSCAQAEKSNCLSRGLPLNPPGTEGRVMYKGEAFPPSGWVSFSFYLLHHGLNPNPLSFGCNKPHHLYVEPGSLKGSARKTSCSPALGHAWTWSWSPGQSCPGLAPGIAGRPRSCHRGHQVGGKRDGAYVPPSLLPGTYPEPGWHRELKNPVPGRL